MNPKPGQKIEIRMNNNVFFDAIVDQWSDEKSVLCLIGTDEKVIIQKTLQDVLLFKIYNEQGQLQNQFNNLLDDYIDDDNLQDLSLIKDKMNIAERQDLSDKFRYPKLEGQLNNYELPRNIKVAGVAQHSGKEVKRTNSKFNTELQNLFSKKH